MLRFSCVFVNSLFLFQLIENELTILRHTPNARLQRLSSLIAFVIERCRLWPKHESLSHSSISAARTMLPYSKIGGHGRQFLQINGRVWGKQL